MQKQAVGPTSSTIFSDLGKRQTYSELPKVISINIVDFEFMPSGDFHTCYHLKEDNNQTLLTDAYAVQRRWKYITLIW
ncbi:MAG: Rpn family recombination-promoting nuclease/putative transposase [Treponema sp.]|nr:Rpn family recombination-promoting nuclease/putative transposase [Treponema sp.]